MVEKYAMSYGFLRPWIRKAVAQWKTSDHGKQKKNMAENAGIFLPIKTDKWFSHVFCNLANLSQSF